MPRKSVLIAALALLLAACGQATREFGSAPQVSSAGYLSEPLPAVDLPIQALPQEGPLWCWAAVSQQIILASRGPRGTPPQCALVALANGAPPEVCCSGPNPQCQRTGALPQIQGLIARYGGRASAYAPPTDPLTLYRTLAGGRAVIIAVAVGGGTGHVIVARGMSFEATPFGWEPMVHVNDPMSAVSQAVPFQRIAGAWREALIVG